MKFFEYVHDGIALTFSSNYNIRPHIYLVKLLMFEILKYHLPRKNSQRPPIFCLLYLITLKIFIHKVFLLHDKKIKIDIRNICYSNFKLQHLPNLQITCQRHYYENSYFIQKIFFEITIWALKLSDRSHTTYATLLVFHPQSLTYGASIQSANPI